MAEREREKMAKMVTVRSDYKTLVSEQYRTVCAKTGEFFREVVKFGALLNEVEGFIGEGRGGVHDNDGLKGWLEENCPDVNYNTAKGYKAMAAKCAKMIGGGVQALACLQGRDEVIEPGTQDVVDVEESFIEKRNALFEEVDSRRKLEQMWFEFLGAPRKPGRPVGTGPFAASGLKALTKENALEGMFENLTKLKVVLDKHRAVLMKYAPALKARHPNECADFAQVAKDYAKCFE